jgi:uncharacterized protein
MTDIRALGLQEARITGGFWAGKMDMVARQLLPYQWLALNDEVPGAEPSHAIENFRIAAGESGGVFKGNIWQDSDVTKWIEAASYSLLYHPDAALEAKVDEVIRLIAKTQQSDGYVNTYFSVVRPDMRWKDLAWGHELYCAGHLIEAAVAHHGATGKQSLLEVARRYADCIDHDFGPEPGKIRGVCGHPEIELALFRLYAATGEARYRDLAIFFVEERGRDPSAFEGRKPLNFFIPETAAFGRDYFLNHEGVRSQTDATGHAVRAVYLYTAMADEYAQTGDGSILEALHALWDSVVSRRMYVTGGIGSQAQGERFTTDYDLPSDTAYNETCASIGLAIWAARMSSIEGDSRYADVLERVVYNGALSGVSLDGTRYFYVNPLEVIPSLTACRQDHEHVEGQRVQWLGCSCCPPNIARLIASIPSYLYGVSPDGLWINQYAQSELETTVGATRVRLTQSTGYPWSGAIVITVDPADKTEFQLRLRIPSWCRSWFCLINGKPVSSRELSRGYLVVSRVWEPGDRIELNLVMESRIVRADPRIPELAGKAAIQRGPLVYCAESVDNGAGLHSLVLSGKGALHTSFDPVLMGGSVRLEAEGFREESARHESCQPGTPPYGDAQDLGLSPSIIVLVPYHQWGNREPGGEMRVWLRVMD